MKLWPICTFARHFTPARNKGTMMYEVAAANKAACIRSGHSSYVGHSLEARLYGHRFVSRKYLQCILREFWFSSPASAMRRKIPILQLHSHVANTLFSKLSVTSPKLTNNSHKSRSRDYNTIVLDSTKTMTFLQLLYIIEPVSYREKIRSLRLSSLNVIWSKLSLGGPDKHIASSGNLLASKKGSHNFMRKVKTVTTCLTDLGMLIFRIHYYVGAFEVHALSDTRVCGEGWQTVAFRLSLSSLRRPVLL